MEEVKYKPTELTFKVKKVRKSKKVELVNGAVIPHEEFKLNWVVVK
jgi:uncharacterized protein YfkK (UPF0435 family)